MFEYTFPGICALAPITVKFSGYFPCCLICDIQFPFYNTILIRTVFGLNDCLLLPTTTYFIVFVFP